MSADTRLLPGERVGRYEIVRYVASGGMGAVYEARADGGEESVALKLLFDVSEAGVERFDREARISSRVRHPNVVSIIENGRTPDGMPFIAMELLRGEDLDRRRARLGYIPARELIDIAGQVCDALHYAHSRGVIHRDLKPQNLFVCEMPAGRVKLLDFGIAAANDERRLTRTGAIIGTWAYVSPEQARGVRGLDGRTDIWSLGVLMYECLTGRLPFECEAGPGLLYQIITNDAPDVGVLRPDLPIALRDVVRRALRKDREGRFQSAEAMHAALDALDLRDLVESVPGAGSDASMGSLNTVNPVALRPTDASREDDAFTESRLTTIVFIRNASERNIVEEAAAELQGWVFAPTGGDMLVAFGAEQWHGDEPLRAVRLATIVSSFAGAIGIATGRSQRGAERVTGAVVNSALALALGIERGIRLDSATASAVRNSVALETSPDGSAMVCVEDHRGLPEAPDALFATSLLDRELELGLLRDATDLALAQQQVSGVVILGMPGIGKSRLMHEATLALRQRHADAVVLTTRCEAYRRDAPFGALNEAVRGLADDGLAHALRARRTGGGDAQSVLDRAHSALEIVLRRLALPHEGCVPRPVVLAVDDAQWLDPASQTAIKWLCENAFDLPLVVWLFARPESRDSLSGLITGATVRELGPLSAGAAGDLLRAVIGDAPDAVLERAAGHPLFLEELGRVYLEGGAASRLSAILPPSIEGAYLVQLDRLSHDEREYLKRGSVFGRSFCAEAVAALGADAEVPAGLRRAGIIVPRPHGRFPGTREFSFRSALLQEVTHRLWTDTQLCRMHARAAQWLTGREQCPADELARHWDLAGDALAAATAYVSAAEVASAVGDTASTCTHAARALALTQDPSLRWRALVSRDAVLALSGDRVLQRNGLREILEAGMLAGGAAAAEAAWRQCYFARLTSDGVSAREFGEHAIALSRKLSDSQWSANAHTDLAFICADAGDHDAARSHASEAMRLAQLGQDPWLAARSLSVLAYVSSARGDIRAALELYESAAIGFAADGDRRREALALANGGAVMFRLGRVACALERLESAIAASRRVGNARNLATATQNRGLIHRVRGEWDAARADLTFVAREAARHVHARLASATATEMLYLELAQTPDRPAPDALIVEAGELAQRSGSPDLITSAAAARLRAFARDGRVSPEALQSERSRLEGLSIGSEPRLELSIAIFEAAGRRSEDAIIAQCELETLAIALGGDDESTAVRAGLCARYMAPAEIAGTQS